MSKYARVFKQLLKEANDDAALDRAAMEALGIPAPVLPRIHGANQEYQVQIRLICFSGGSA
jgi:hypothetical protein